jgi:hypothetical protein
LIAEIILREGETRVLLTVNTLIAGSFSHHQVCSAIGLPYNCHPYFKKVIKKLDDLKQEPGFV